MTAPDLCPLCGADLTGEPIEICYGVISEFDGLVDLYEGRCPDCNATWPVETQQP